MWSWVAVRPDRSQPFKSEAGGLQRGQNRSEDFFIAGMYLLYLSITSQISGSLLGPEMPGSCIKAPWNTLMV